MVERLREVHRHLRIVIDEDDDAPITDELLNETIVQALEATGMVPAKGRYALIDTVEVEIL